MTPPTKPKLASSKSNVIELAPPPELTPFHREQLRSSGLTDEYVDKLVALGRVRTELNVFAASRDWLTKLLGWKVTRNRESALVFAIVTPAQPEPISYRVKFGDPRTSKQTGKKIKYEQPDKKPALVWFSPNAIESGGYKDPTRILYFTEGEKKALALDQEGLVCVGLFGVWNFGDVAYKKENDGAERLHPLIAEHVTIAGRACVVCYDADARTNDQVMLAAQRLAGVLLAAGAASVKFICPPSSEHKGIDDYFAAHGREAMLQLLARTEDIEPADPKEPLAKLKSIKALSAAPVSNELRMPEGYKIEKDGSLWASARDEKHSDTKIARSPILVQRYLDDLSSGEKRVEVCFTGDSGHWASLVVPRKALADTRSLIAELAPFGAPCNSNNASRFVDWLADLTAVNTGRVPHVRCVALTGWHELESHRVFMFDERIVRDGEEAPELIADTRGDRRRIFEALRPVTRGKTDDAAEALDLAHRDALRRAWQADDVCAALIAASLAAPLLKIVSAPNFGVHLPGDSSRGKTSMLKIAASIWGNANSEQLVGNWNVTPVAAELRAATLCDLPQFYDEIGSAADPEQLQQLVYMLINGGGRARGNVSLQLRETPSWRTILLSTGEKTLVNEDSATGAQIRIIHLPVSRFGKLGADGVDELRETCIAHAGAFGRWWIEALLDTDAAFIVQSYKNAVARLRAEAKEPLQARLAGYFAVLCVAEHLASKLGLGEADAPTMRRLFASPSRRAEVKPLAEKARDLAMDWVLAEQDAFPLLAMQPSGAEDADRKRGARTVHGFRRDSGETYFIPSSFRRWCADHRLDPHGVLRAWQAKGWLVHAKDRLEKKVRIGNATPWMHALTAEASYVVPQSIPAAEQSAMQEAASVLSGHLADSLGKDFAGDESGDA